jgi:YD repeat-containing protein
MKSRSIRTSKRWQTICFVLLLFAALTGFAQAAMQPLKLYAICANGGQGGFGDSIDDDVGAVRIHTTLVGSVPDGRYNIHLSNGNDFFVDVFAGAVSYNQDAVVWADNGFYIGIGGTFPGMSIVPAGNVTGGPATDGFVIIEGEHFDCCSYGCSNYLTYYQTLNAYITFNPTPTPTPGANTKCNDDKSGGNSENCPSCNAGMARYTVNSMLVSLNIADTPLRYSPAYGPAIGFSVTYNQRDTQQPATFNYSNLGPKWTFGWLSYVSDDPNVQLPLTGLYRSGGGAEIFAYDSPSQSFVADAQSHAVLVKTGAATYERRMPDGSKEVFALSDGATSYPRRIFMTQMVDPTGNTVAIGYDASFRVTTITDALGQVTNVSYELPADPLKVTRVTDPFGRFATFEYTNGQLTKITDEIGIQSQFTYTTGTDFIESLATPYGMTTFVSGENGTNRWIEMTDPLGGKERVEYRDQAPGISASDPVAPNAAGITNAGLDMANTFYWDKKAMLVAPGDYTQAKIKHWLYNTDGSVSGILSSEKQPLENRVWSTYAGQPDYQHAGPSANPSQTARVLGDGSTQLHQFEYNSVGKTTKTTDPIGRVMSYVYDTNNIDLLEIRQTRGTNNELQRKFTYNALHEPLTDTDAAGQVTTYTYNAQGQVLTRKNAKNETTTYAYGGTVPAGLLASITGPPFNSVSAVTTFTYDSFKRVRTVTDFGQLHDHDRLR